MIAQKAKAPIVVVSTHGTAAISRNFPFRSTSVTLSVREVLPAEEVVSVRTNQLSERIRGVLEAALTESAV